MGNPREKRKITKCEISAHDNASDVADLPVGKAAGRENDETNPFQPPV